MESNKDRYLDIFNITSLGVVLPCLIPFLSHNLRSGAEIAQCLQSDSLMQSLNIITICC